MNPAIIQQFQSLVAAGKNADEIRAILIGEGVSEQDVSSLLNTPPATPTAAPVTPVTPGVPPVAPSAPPPQPAPSQAPSGGSLPDYILITKDSGMNRESLRTFHISDGAQVLYVVNLSGKFRIDIYHDEAKTSLAFSLDSKSFKEKMSNKYDVIDASGTVLGAVKAKVLESMVTEKWEILDAADNQIGTVEQAMASAMLGRLMPGVEQSYTATINNQVLCSYQLANKAGAMGTMASFGLGLPQLNMDIHYSPNITDGLTRLLGLAVGVLLGTEFGERR
ncbi:MAG TPA: hypothetical protein VMR75_00515 [Candidatus Saccharimonadales bacterium]|nr:hypothetical protein [Candidatus Saccharimonadales bacterium]